MFLEKKKYEKINKVSRCFFIGTLITMLISIVIKVGFDGTLATHVAKVGTLFFFSGLIVESIPDFIEKNTRRIILKILVIISLVVVWIVV